MTLEDKYLWHQVYDLYDVYRFISITMKGTVILRCGGLRVVRPGNIQALGRYVNEVDLFFVKGFKTRLVTRKNLDGNWISLYLGTPRWKNLSTYRSKID